MKAKTVFLFVPLSLLLLSFPASAEEDGTPAGDLPTTDRTVREWDNHAFPAEITSEFSAPPGSENRFMPWIFTAGAMAGAAVVFLFVSRRTG